MYKMMPSIFNKVQSCIINLKLLLQSCKNLGDNITSCKCQTTGGLIDSFPAYILDGRIVKLRTNSIMLRGS